MVPLTIELQKKLAFPLVHFPREQCVGPHPPIRHGHLGVYKQSQRQRNYIGVAIPVGRLAAPAEVGALVAYLCSQHAGYITGAVLPIDGGALRGIW